MDKQAVILAGGKGTRLRDVLGDMPKPMLKIGDKPLLEHQILLARQHGFKRLLVLVAHNPHFITDYFGDGSAWGVEIKYRHESTPLGTAGAMIDAFDELQDRFLVMYGDTMLNVDLERFWQVHGGHQADVSLFLHPNDHPCDSDLVDVDAEGWVKALHPYPHPRDVWYRNLVNAALYVMNKSALEPWKGSRVKADLAKDVFPKLLTRGNRIYGYRSPEYIKDVGTVERYERVSGDYHSGRITRGALSIARPAVFLDRDGTLIEDVNGLTAPDEVRMLPGVADAIRAVNESERYAILVTNQPVIAKGQCTVEQMEMIHGKLESLLGEHGAYLDAIYYCPHHPDKGFPGEIPELKMDCECRKPGIGLIRQAVADFNVDLGRSWLVGDTTRDVETARRAGIRSVLVKTGHKGEDGKYPVRADFEFDTLSEAVQLMVKDRLGEALQ